MKIKAKYSLEILTLIVFATSFLMVSCVAVNPVQYPTSRVWKSSPYAHIYFTPSIMQVKKYAPNDIKKEAIMRLYPAPIREVWAASLDIVSQYDSIWQLNQENRIIIFSQGYKVVTNKKISSNAGKYVDVFIILHLEAHGEESTAVYLAWVTPNTLCLAPIPIPDEEQMERLESLPDSQLFEVTSSLIAQQFYQHLAIQIFSVQEWQRKFIDKNDTFKIYQLSYSN